MSKRFVVIVILIIAVCVIGCVAYSIYKNSSKFFENELTKMRGKNVNLNFKEAEVYYNGLDTAFNHTNAYKLVVFVDSLSCSGCFLNHLILYYDINDSLLNKDGRLVIVLHPQQGKIDLIRRKVLTDKYHFWCIIDKNGEFIRNNPGFPGNKLLHSFMLDENNDITHVGDPSSNPKVKELFIKQLNQEYLNPDIQTDREKKLSDV